MKCFFVTCGPNEALVVSGCGHRKALLVPGGRVFVWPIFQECHTISLNVMTLQVDSPMVYTSEGVPISVTGIAQIKIQGQNREMLSTACELFLGKSEREIALIALSTLEGHQRAIMGSMTVEEIYKDRKKFSANVFEVASTDLVNMGITVVSYTLKDVRDDEGYLLSLGMARTAQVKRDARIGEAEAKKDATIKEAMAEEERMASRLFNDTEIAKAKRDYELKRAAAEVEVERKKAEAEMAFELQTAKLREKVMDEKMQISVVERSKRIDLEEAELTRKLQQLESEVKVPAAAEKYKMQKLSEANRNRVILEAQAEAEAIRLMGEAEAFAIQAKAKAEKDQMSKKAEAFNEYQDTAIIEMILDVLPQIASAISTPLSQTKRISVVSSGEEIGVAKLTSEVFSILTQVPNFVKTLTGIDIAQRRGFLEVLETKDRKILGPVREIGEVRRRHKTELYAYRMRMQQDLKQWDRLRNKPEPQGVSSKKACTEERKQEHERTSSLRDRNRFANRRG